MGVWVEASIRHPFSPKSVLLKERGRCAVMASQKPKEVESHYGLSCCDLHPSMTKTEESKEKARMVRRLGPAVFASLHHEQLSKAT